MSIRLIHREVSSCDKGEGQGWAKVLFDTEVREYRVKFYDGAEYLPRADYFTDDKADAMGTAKKECERMNQAQ